MAASHVAERHWPCSGFAVFLRNTTAAIDHVTHCPSYASRRSDRSTVSTGVGNGTRASQARVPAPSYHAGTGALWDCLAMHSDASEQRAADARSGGALV